MPLNASPGHAEANSYVASLTEADDVANVLQLVPGLGFSTAGYTAATDVAKEAALVMAADRIDRLVFRGQPSSFDQARAWPRVGTGMPRFDGIVPDVVKQAQVAEACVLLSSPDVAASMIAKGVSSYTVAEESVTFGTSASVGASRPLSAVAESLLVGAGLTGGPAGSVYVPRG